MHKNHRLSTPTRRLTDSVARSCPLSLCLPSLGICYSTWCNRCLVPTSIILTKNFTCLKHNTIAEQSFTKSVVVFFFVFSCLDKTFAQIYIFLIRLYSTGGQAMKKITSLDTILVCPNLILSLI